MKSEDIHMLVTTIADIVSLTGNDSGSTQVGLTLNKSSFWLTPTQCHHLARIIKEHNDEYYIDWNVDRPTVDLLERSSNQNV